MFLKIGGATTLLLITVAVFFFLKTKNDYDLEGNVSYYQASKKDTSMTFETRVTGIRKKIVDLTSPSDLFTVPEFIEVYENPLLYFGEAETFISNSSNSEVDKEIVIYSMNKVELSYYVKFVNGCFESFKKGDLPEDLLERAISYPFSKNLLIVENFEDQKVRLLLEDILEDKNTHLKLKNKITDILSGKTWTEIKKFREESGY